jgi:membrane-bound ClpP family serine protease
MIIIGAVLTVSILFSYIGLPLVIIGVLLFIISIFLLVQGVLGSFSSFFRIRRPKKSRKKEKIIDLTEKDGFYEAK